jgi:hypothetical protein
MLTSTEPWNVPPFGEITGVATVDATGLVTGAGVGNTKIAATYHGATGTATIDVTP